MHSLGLGRNLNVQLEKVNPSPWDDKSSEACTSIGLSIRFEKLISCHQPLIVCFWKSSRFGNKLSSEVV
jgi:hypothetical protein